jgi:hypothetical protein
VPLRKRVANAKLGIAVFKVQLLKLFNIEESPESKPPGDLRLWKALEQALPNIKFLRFRVIGVDWAEEIQASHLDIHKWNDLLGMPGLVSVSLGHECEFPSLQRRRLGERSSDLEILVAELLEAEGLPAASEIWEADHYELLTSANAQTLSDSIQKLLAIGSRSGLLDPDNEELRWVMPGESWSWPRRTGFSETLRTMSLDELIDRWRELSDSSKIPDPMRRGYVIREQQARMAAQNREEKCFLDRLSQLEEDRRSPEVDALKSDILISAPRSYFLHFHRFADPFDFMNETRAFILNQCVMSDAAFGNFLWSDEQGFRLSPQFVGQKFQSFFKAAPAGSFRLYVMKPMAKSSAILWRRLSSLMSLFKDLIEGEARYLSGDEMWLVAFRNFISVHSGWELKEESIRVLFEFEAERVPQQTLVMFFSAWSYERLRDTFKTYGFEIFDMGGVCEEASALRVHLNAGGYKDVHWIEIFSNQDLGFGEMKTDRIHWTAPDLKSPTYGFEKVSIFPDQYLLRSMNYGLRGEAERALSRAFCGAAHSRETFLRNKVTSPVAGHKWVSASRKFYADGMGNGSPASSANPKAASRIALDMALRNLVARGVSPDSTLFLSAALAKPRATEILEKDAVSFGAFTLGVEGIIESVEQLKNVVIAEIDFSSLAPEGQEYWVEPLVHLRGEVASGAHPAFCGFRMSGESIYALGPRPAFMDVGSRVLNHVRVMSNHVTHLSWEQQIELYQIVHKCLCEQIITDIRPIGWGGVAETLVEMSLWSGIGVQLKPSLSPVDLFSACPGRFVVGVLPQEAKRFESLVKSELLTPIGTTGGEKLFGLPLEKYKEARSIRLL